ncbi:MAG TPA: DUF368 domain-containing protein [Clostridiales bacterium]|nr:DUF368 domain-containing protein [Clostridiales bacterium]
MLSDFLKGLVIGIGAIAPGISGGSLAVILGIYERITGAIANMFDDFWKKVKEFLPMAAGGVIGVVGFSNIVTFLFKNYEIEVKYLFIGLMAGTFPSLRRQADKHGFKIIYLVPFVITLAAAIWFAVSENTEAGSSVVYRADVIMLAVYGAIIGFGTIIPGISASFLLMYLGAYDILMEGISRLNPAILIPAGLGFVVSILAFSKLINLLFKKAYGYTYYAVFGLTLGSVLAIFPGFELGWRYLLCTLLLVAGFALSLYLSRFEAKES